MLLWCSSWIKARKRRGKRGKSWNSEPVPAPQPCLAQHFFQRRERLGSLWLTNNRSSVPGLLAVWKRHPLAPLSISGVRIEGHQQVKLLFMSGKPINTLLLWLTLSFLFRVLENLLQNVEHIDYNYYYDIIFYYIIIIIKSIFETAIFMLHLWCLISGILQIVITSFPTLASPKV